MDPKAMEAMNGCSYYEWFIHSQKGLVSLSDVRIFITYNARYFINLFFHS